MSEIKALDKLRGYVYMGYIAMLDKDGTLLNLEAACDAIQAEVDSRFMELPVDADGVPIRVGDMIEYEGDEDTYRLHARGVYVYEDGHVAVMNERLGIWYQENCRHVKPRTLEDVLREFAENAVCCNQFGSLYANEDAIAKSAAEIRELLGVVE